MLHSFVSGVSKDASFARAWHQRVSSSIRTALKGFEIFGHARAALADQQTTSQSCANCSQTSPVDQSSSGLAVDRIGLR